MDTITHGIVGALIGKAFFAEDPGRLAPSLREKPRNAGRVAIAAATLSAMFPDIDVFAGPLAHNSMAIITWHRNITHSLILLPVWAAALALIFRWLAGRLDWPSPSISDLFAICAIGLASHIFLDVITSFGTMVWSPINYARPAWDWVFILDLTLTSLALVPQLAAWAFQRPEHVWRRAPALWLICSAVVFGIAHAVRAMDVPFSDVATGTFVFALAVAFLLPLQRGIGARVRRPKWCRIGIALLTGYLAFASGMHHSALQHVSDFAEQTQLNIESVAALPLPPSAARWAGLIMAPEGIYRVQFNQFGDEPVGILFFPQAPPNRFIVAARELKDVQTFLWFARFPLFQFQESGGREIVRISDLTFYDVRARPWRGVGDKSAYSNFAYEVVFSPDGQLISQGWAARR